MYKRQGPALFDAVVDSYNPAARDGRGVYELMVTNTGEELRWYQETTDKGYYVLHVIVNMANNLTTD